MYVGLFPNLLISLHPDYVMTHRLEPVAPADPRRVPVAVPARGGRAPGFDPSYAVDFWDLTNRQDWARVRDRAARDARRSVLPGLLAPQEDGVYQFVTMVAHGYLGG